jgi:hypothetical protein
MSSILVEILTQLLGEAVSSRIPNPQPPEGILNGSLGAIAAFFGLLSALFAAPAVVFVAQSGDALVVVFVLCLVVAACASLGILAGRRAPRVTSRNLALARVGYRTSEVALAASVLALVVALVRALA